MKRRTILRILLFAVLVGATGIVLLARHALEARGPAFDTPKAISIDDGESLAVIARRLEEERILVHPRVLLALARLRGVDRHVRSGVYDFAGGARAGEVLDALVSGPQRLEFVSIPEGWTVDQIAHRLEAAGLGPAERYRELASDPRFATSLGVPAGRLEGYLFPDTYSFGKDPKPEDVLRRMTERFFEVFDDDLAGAAATQGLSVHQAVTLASIIEAEAAIPEERALIAAVFRNRLARGMPLQADPTVLYGVADGRRPISRADLERSTPYNTYVISGLPPGPICNPGLAALSAAVHPSEDDDVLYFVARNDRSHEFNATLAAHVRAVRKYQRRQPRPGSRAGRRAAPGRQRDE